MIFVFRFARLCALCVVSSIKGSCSKCRCCDAPRVNVGIALLLAPSAFLELDRSWWRLVVASALVDDVV